MNARAAATILALVALAAAPAQDPASNRIPAPQPGATPAAAPKPRFDIHVQDGKIQVLLGGQLVPESQWRRTADHLEILASDGRVLHKLALPPQLRQGPPPPSVMTGLRFETPATALAKHATFDAASTSLVTHVLAGGPGALAGVEEHDVVLAAKGAASADPKSLRSLLRSLKPGDELSLTLLRAGQRVEVTVKLAPYTFQPLPAPSAPVAPPPGAKP